MSCLINRNAKGLITEVKTPSGERSQLFDAIHNNLFMADAETSVKILSNIYSDELQEMFSGADKYVYSTGEPQLFYQDTKGRIEVDLGDVLITNNSIGDIRMGVINPQTDEFIPLAKFNNASSKRGQFLNSQVKEGFLSWQRVLGTDGITRFQGKGSYERTKVLSARGALYNAMTDLGIMAQVDQQGQITFPFDSEFVTAVSEEGSTRVMHINDVTPQTVRGVENEADLLIQAYSPLTGTTKLNDSNSQAIIPTNLLEKKLISFSNSLGVSITTMENYRQDYSTKMGHNPDILALFDMNNKLIAIGEGVDVTQELLEEVSHLAVEAYSEQSSIEDALVNIHLTQEYKEWNEKYRAVYGQQLSGLTLEQKVRKEVFGKIVAKAAQSQFQLNTDPTVLERAREVWTNFVNYLRSIFKPYHRRALEKLANDVSENMLLQNTERFSNEISSTETYYSLDKEGRSIEQDIRLALTGLQALYQSVLRSETFDSGIATQISENMSAAGTLTASERISSQVRNQLRKIEARFKGLEKGQTLENTDLAAYQNIKDQTIPLLASIRTGLKDHSWDAKLAQQARSVIEDIESTILLSSEIQPLFEKSQEAVADKVIEDTFTDIGTPQNIIDEEKAKIKGGVEDLGFLGRLFGLASHMNNPLVAILARLVEKMNATVTKRLKLEADPFIKEISAKGYEKYQDKIFQVKDGKRTHYVESPLDYAEDDQQQGAEKLRLVVELSGKSEEEVKKELLTKTEHQILGNDQLVSQFTSSMREWRQNSAERPFTTEYYLQQQEDYKTANVSEYTKENIQQASQKNFTRTKNFRNKDGIVDKSLFIEADRLSEQQAYREFKAIKSPLDSSGNLYPGLRQVRAQDLTETQKNNLPFKLEEDYRGTLIILDSNSNLDELSEDARMALDLFNLDMIRRERRSVSSTDRSASEAFKNELVEAKKRDGNDYEWAIANSSITLTEEYYNSIGEGESYEDAVLEYLETLDEEGQQPIRAALKALTQVQNERKELLKQYRNNKNTLNINAVDMTSNIRAKVVSLEEDVLHYKRLIKLPSEIRERLAKGQTGTTRELNDDFYSLQKESGKSVYEFSIDNMTATNKVEVQTFARDLKNILDGTSKAFTKSGYEKFIEEMQVMGAIDSSMDNSQIENILLDEFSKRRVSSSFQRYSPQGYNEAINALETGKVTVYDLISDPEKTIEKYPGFKYITIAPDYAWTNFISANEFMNPKFKKGYFRQPRTLNENFFDKYGINKEQYYNAETDSLDELTPTKNIEEYEYLKMYVALNKQADSNYGDADNINPFLAVQMTSTGLEKAASAFTIKGVKSSVKDALKDVIHNRIDEKDYGEEADGLSLVRDLGVRVPPKYFQARVEDPGSLTANSNYALILKLKESIKYQERNNTSGQANAILHQIENQKVVNKRGKAGRTLIQSKDAVSGWIKFAEEYVDHQFYGVKQTRKMEMNAFGKTVDMTRAINVVQGFARFTNLGFNPLVDLTSLTTGLVNNWSDRFAGEFYHRSSFDRGAGQLTSMSAKYMAEAGSMNKTSQLNTLTEFFGTEGIESKVRNSKFSRAFRLMSKAPFMMSKLANVPVTHQILLTILNDYRYVDGKFRSYRDFYNYKVSQDKSINRKQIEAEWLNIKNDSLYDNILIDSSSVSAKQNFKDKFPETWEEEFDKLHVTLTAKIRNLIQSVDGVINETDQVAAQRDAFMNIFMMHKGWLPISLTKRFKKRSYNYTTGQVEEGHYRTFGNLLVDMYQGLKDKRGIKAVWDELTPTQQKNIKRVSVELGFAGFILAMGTLVLGMDDGDDDTFAENLFTLIYLRTVSEYNSSQLIGLPGSLIESVESPITAIKTYKALYEIPLDLASGEFKDAGENAVKVTLLKRFNQLSDLDTQISAFRHFNDRTLITLGEKKATDSEEGE